MYRLDKKYKRKSPIEYASDLDIGPEASGSTACPAAPPCTSLAILDRSGFVISNPSCQPNVTEGFELMNQNLNTGLSSSTEQEYQVNNLTLTINIL